jgi:predicted signal transduction protein with EAL and GGDEF domain
MTTRSHTSHPALPAESAAALQRLLDTELSLPSRLGYVALLLAALTMTAVVTALWVTEPVLPLRAQIGFALIVAIGLSWIVFAIWALTHRRILFARHQIIAGRMAVIFTTVFLLGTLVVGYSTGRPDAYKATAVGIVLLGMAVVVLVRAKRAFARLVSRRDALARELGRSAR